MNLATSTVTASILLSALVITMTEPPEAPKPGVQATTRLPPLPSTPAAHDAAASLQLLTTTLMWGPRAGVAPSRGTAGAAAANQPVWRLSGTAWVQGEWRVVLQDDRRMAPTQLLRAQELLPDGRRVVEVRRNGARLAPAAATQASDATSPAEQWVDIPRRTPSP